jgi:hypothetical protein
VIERSEEENDVDRLVGLDEASRISFTATKASNGARGQHVTWNRADEFDVVTVLRQPLRVNAGCAADVEDPRRRRRQRSTEYQLGAGELEAAMWRSSEAGPLVDGTVVLEHLLQVIFGHAPCSRSVLMCHLQLASPLTANRIDNFANRSFSTRKMALLDPPATPQHHRGRDDDCR